MLKGVSGEPGRTGMWTAGRYFSPSGDIDSRHAICQGDVREFLNIAAEMPFIPDVETYPFDDANRAIMDIKQRKIRGAKVLAIYEQA